MSLFGELRRRNVFRIGAAYVVTSWLLIQVTETIFPLFGFDETPARIVVVVLAIGLIPALVFSWVFELTPEGLKKESEVDRSQSITPLTGNKLDRIIMVVLAVALAYFAFDKFVLDPARDLSREASAREEGRSEALVESYGGRSIAVLPFVNMSSDPEQEFFSDGIAEELLNLLTKIPQLRVIARTSSFAFKGQNISIDDIAQKLNVAHILEGSVRKSGDQVRITTQLVRASDSSHLWSESYDRTLEDIFAVQEEIAATVVEKLKVSLLGAAPTLEMVDPAAYVLLLRARYVASDQSTSDFMEQSITLLKQALEIDPEYATAWADLGYAYTTRRYRRSWEDRETRKLASEAANHALSISPTNATALATLGIIAKGWDHDLAAAAHYFESALESEPTSYPTLSRALFLMRTLRRYEAAIAIGNYMVTIDPLRARAWDNLGWAYHAAGRWDEALAAFRRAVSLSPVAIQARIGVGLSLLEKGEPEAALASMQQETIDHMKLVGMVFAYHAMGKEAESDAVLAQLIENYGHYRPAVIASAYSYRGEVDRAFEWLDKTIQIEESDLIPWIDGNLFVPLYDDPRWQPFIESVGLSQAQLDAIEFDVNLPDSTG